MLVIFSLVGVGIFFGLAWGEVYITRKYQKQLARINWPLVGKWAGLIVTIAYFGTLIGIGLTSLFGFSTIALDIFSNANDFTLMVVLTLVMAVVGYFTSDPLVKELNIIYDQHISKLAQRKHVSKSKARVGNIK